MRGRAVGVGKVCSQLLGSREMSGSGKEEDFLDLGWRKLAMTGHLSLLHWYVNYI